MIEVFYGPDYGFSLKRAKEEMKKAAKGEEILSYDGYRDPVSSVNQELSSLSLFGGNKHILFQGCYFLSSSRSGRKEGPVPEKEQDYQGLLDYLKDPVMEDDLFLVVPGPLQKKGDFYDILSKKAQLKECTSMTEDDFVTLAFSLAKEENKAIDRKAASLLYSYTEGDYLSFVNNLKKLLTYTDSVHEEDVLLLVHRPLENNAFDIVSSLLGGNSKRAMSLYEDLLEGGREPYTLIGTMASQFSFFAQVKALLDMGFKDNDAIAKELSGKSKRISSGRVYYARKEMGRLSFLDFLKILNDLHGIDEDYKKHQEDIDTRLTLFLTSFKDRYLLKR